MGHTALAKLLHLGPASGALNNENRRVYARKDEGDYGERWFAQAEILHGLKVRLLDFHRVDGAARMRAQFVGPLRHPARLLFDVTLDEPVLLPPQQRQIVVSFFTDLSPHVLTYTLEEILAEKMRSILQRGKSRDYYDVWRLLKEKSDSFDADLVRSILRSKCRHKGLEAPSAKALLAPDRLEDARPYWERDLAQQVARPLPEWATVTTELPSLLAHLLQER